MRAYYISLILKNKTHVQKLFDPTPKNDAFAGSTPMKAAYIVFRNNGYCNFLTGNYCADVDILTLNRASTHITNFKIGTFNKITNNNK